MDIFMTGFHCKASGASPLALDEAFPRNLEDYELTGNLEGYYEYDETKYKIPNGITTREYIENSASGAKVSTGVVPSSLDCEYYCKFYCADAGSLYLMQSRYNGGDIWGITGSQTGGTIQFAINGTAVTSSITRTVGHTYEVTASCDSDGEMYLNVVDLTNGDGATNSATVSALGSPTAELSLFTNASDNPIAAGHRVYEAYYKEGGEYKFILVPTLDSSDAVGMRDLITATQMTTSGTFSGGNKLMKYREVGDKTGQQIQPDSASSGTRYGVTFINNGDGSWTLSGTPSQDNCFYNINYEAGVNKLVDGHKYVLTKGNNSDLPIGCEVVASSTIAQSYTGDRIFTASLGGATTSWVRFRVYNMTGTAIEITTTPQLFDLTEMGIADSISTIADFKAWLVSHGYMSSTSEEIPYIPYGYEIPLPLASNCGMVVLDGSADENWNYDSTYGRFSIAISGAKYGAARTIEAYANGWVCLHNSEPISSAQNGDFYIGQSGIYFHDAVTSLDMWRAKIGANPIVLFYQRTTDSSWTAPTVHKMYLPKPLGKVGDIVDKASLLGGGVYKMDEITIDGSESGWGTYARVANTYYLGIENAKASQGAAVICSRKYEGASSQGTDKGVYCGATNIGSVQCGAFYFTDTDHTDLASFLADLADDPITMYYIVRADDTESITAPTIELADGLNYLGSNADVSPSSMSAQFRSRTI